MTEAPIAESGIEDDPIIPDRTNLKPMTTSPRKSPTTKTCPTQQKNRRPDRGHITEPLPR